MIFRRTRGKLASTTQAGIERLRKYKKGANFVLSNIAKIKAVHSDRATCDIQSWSGAATYNVPVRTKGGLIDDEVYGELDLPTVGDHVIVSFLGNNESDPIIEGTLLPYLHSKFQSSQTPVDSSSKQFTKKLLESEKEKTYRKIFKSGTTMEVSEDGSYIIETPSGSYIRINEDSSGDIIIEANGNKFSMESGKVVINDNLEILQ